MLHSMKGFSLMLVVFVFACSYGFGQGGVSAKLHEIPVTDTASQEAGPSPQPDRTEIAAGNRDLPGDRGGKAEASSKLDFVLRDDEGSTAVEDIEKQDSRGLWTPRVEFPRVVNPDIETVPDRPDDDDPANPPTSAKFHWKRAIHQSLVAQGFQHGYALIFQEKTRRALKGPFFRDYWKSIKGVRGWSDENRFFTNYIAHPMQGSFTGFIFVQNHDRAKKQVFNESAQYWKDRLKAFAWSAAWSTNWEIGPISQSSIGNVGLYGRQGYVDLVITPTVGTAWMIAEEALDRYIIRHHDSKSLARRIILRTFLNPTRSVANVFRFKVPWHRDHRD